MWVQTAGGSRKVVFHSAPGSGTGGRYEEPPVHHRRSSDPVATKEEGMEWFRSGGPWGVTSQLLQTAAQAMDAAAKAVRNCAGVCVAQARNRTFSKGLPSHVEAAAAGS